MEINIRDLSNEIKESKYKFRMLTLEDEPQMQVIIKEAFVKYNQGFIALGIDSTEYDILMKNVNFGDIIQQNLTFGAFLGDQLASIAFMCDLSINFVNPIAISPIVLRMLTVLEGNLKEYKETHKYELGQVAYLYILSTDITHTRNNLATLSLYLACLEAKKRGFVDFLTEAAHIGTINAVKKVFKEHKVEKEITEAEGIKLSVLVMSAKL